MVAVGARNDVATQLCSPHSSTASTFAGPWLGRVASSGYGYFLYRQPHEFRGEQYIKADLAAAPFGALGATTWTTAAGTVRSDVDLAFTEEFASAGSAELIISPIGSVAGGIRMDAGVVAVCVIVLAGLFRGRRWGQIPGPGGADVAGIVALGVPDRLARPLRGLLPVTELAVAALLAWSPISRIGGAAAAVLLTGFTLLIVGNLAHGRHPALRLFRIGKPHTDRPRYLNAVTRRCWR